MKDLTEEELSDALKDFHAAEDEDAEAGLLSGPPPADDVDTDGRAVVRITSDLSETLSRALAVLPDDPDLYQRGGQLVTIAHEAEPGSRDARLFGAGAPRIMPIAPAVLRYRLSVVARWMRSRKTKEGFEWSQSRPDGDCVAAIHQMGEWPRVRPIVGVLESPILRPDGTVHDVPGYDDATAYVYEPSEPFPRVADVPTREDARHALEMLQEPFAEFPWATEACLSAALCAVLALVARPAIDGPVPAILIDKNTPGTGGSLCADVISIIATGRISARMSWPPTQEELAKVLDAYALRSALLVNFDNIPPSLSFSGPSLDKYLTAETIECRVLGKSEAPIVRWRAVIIGSGNNLTVSGDTVRRVLRARMETNLERPQDREGFRIGDLKAWTKLHRAKLVHAALTILRGYIAAGRPSAGIKPWGSFESFSSLVPAALVWAGAANPLGAQIDSANAGDPELVAHATILRDWSRVAPAGATLRSVVGTLYPNGKPPPAHTRDGEPLPSDGLDDLRDALEAMAPPLRPGMAPDGKKLGNNLRRFLRVVRGSVRMTSTLDRKGVALWSVETVG